MQKKRESAVARKIRERIDEIEVSKHVYEVPAPEDTENFSFEERMKRKVTTGECKRRKRTSEEPSNDLSSEEVVEPEEPIPLKKDTKMKCGCVSHGRSQAPVG